MTATVYSYDEMMRDMYPRPGERFKQWVVDARRDRVWEYETCPKIEIDVHDDNTGIGCRNVGSTAWIDLDHDCCSHCGDEYESFRCHPAAVAWLALKAARPPIEADRTKLSDEIASDVSMAEHPIMRMVRR